MKTPCVLPPTTQPDNNRLSSTAPTVHTTQSIDSHKTTEHDKTTEQSFNQTKLTDLPDVLLPGILTHIDYNMVRLLNQH